jgi:hypothetical protein
MVAALGWGVLSERDRGYIRMTEGSMALGAIGVHSGQDLASPVSTPFQTILATDTNARMVQMS